MAIHVINSTVLGRGGCVLCPFYTQVPILTALSHYRMFTRIYENLSLHYSTYKHEESYRILQYYKVMVEMLFRYLVLVAMYIFVWSPIQKFSSLSHLLMQL